MLLLLRIRDCVAVSSRPARCRDANNSGRGFALRNDIEEALRGTDGDLDRGRLDLEFGIVGFQGYLDQCLSGFVEYDLPVNDLHRRDSVGQVNRYASCLGGRFRWGRLTTPTTTVATTTLDWR